MTNETIHSESENREESKIGFDPEEDISIKQFIEKKKLQNKILGELIEKIKKSDSEPSDQ